MAYGSSKVRTFDTLKRKTQKIENKNNGGIIGAAGYLAGSAAAGVAGVAEGIIDLGVAFGADITGNHDYAEYVFKDNVVGDWHESITEDYNPDDVIKFGGDVAHGLGQSSWFLLSLIPGAQWLGPAVFGAGMVGQGISSAAEQTGDVGVKEVAYGATTAALETGLETALGGMGKVAKTGVGAIAKATGKSTFQKIASSAARKGLARKIFSDAAGEFAEEFISEYADTFLQKLYQINPNAEYSLTNALYAGAVGAVSGGVSAGSVDVISTTARQQSGAKVIKDGNAQTLVNTATHVADKLAASGTNFKHAAEWVRTLRGEVDAYNKLSPEAQKGLRGQTILGEMKASLYFAESQAIHGGIVEKIKNESEENRAALAEYINRSIDKSKRKRDYTAADIAADTDEIATQLGIMNMAGTTFFNFEGAMADMAMERGIESVIEKERASGVKSAQSEASTAQAAPVDEAFAAAVAKTEPSTVSETTQYDLKDDVADIEASVTEIDDDIARIRQSVKKAVSKIEVDGKLYELSDKHINNIANGVQKYIRQGMSESEAIAKAVETRLVDIKSIGEESGVKHELGKATLKKVRGAVINAYRGEMQNSSTKSGSKTAQEAQKATEGTEAQRSAENVAEAKESGKAAEKSSESKNESTESKKTEDQSGSPKISEAKESLTDEQRAERAKKQADKWIEWEKKTAPTAKELNTAREYVKGFDSLNNRRRLAIIRMIRSSEGVDAQTVKGIANVMAVIPESDLEVRFANGIGNKGLITKIGNKSVIVIDSSTDRKTTIKGTIAHELTHFLENKAGYSTFAKYVRDHAKPEAIEKHKNRYINGWAKIGHKYTEAELDSEITASLVADALNNERFLKRYADRDKKLIQKAFEWLKGLAGRAKNKGKETEEISEITDEMALNLIGLLQSDKTTGENKSGTKYSFSSIAYTFFGEEDMTVGEFTERDYKKTEGYKSYVEECLNNFRQSRGDNFNEAAARKEIEDGIAGIVRVAVAAKNAGYDIYDSAGQRTTRDSKQRLLFSSLEPNSDYFTSSDISTICDKRKNFTEIEAEINRIEAERGVPREKRFFADINNFFTLHEILAKHGLTTACRECYVESMRKNFGKMANAFIDLVTETDENNKSNKQLYNKGVLKSGNADLRRRVRELIEQENIPSEYLTFESLTNGDKLADMRLQYPLLFEAYNSFYGQSKPKMPKSATPFRFGELTALLTDDNGKISQSRLKRIDSTGGFRLQSYSDFQIKNYVDVLQVIFEAGTLGLNGHAYTKVPAFLDATEGTNLKRNISIFMYRDGDEWKIDRNDSFPWALDKIYDVVNADKSGDTGIIAVSQNEDMSAWIMANDNVGYGIPFHKSGTKMAVVRETVVKTPQGDVKGYLGIKDHTKYQSEVYASGESKGKKVKAPINIYEFWDFNNTRMSRNNLIEKNVKKYIDECERLGYLPKFRDYVMNNEKVLNATLAYAKKLGYADANATVEDISFKYKGYTIPYGYYKFLVDFGVFTPEGKASPVKALSLKDYNFDKAVSFFSDSKKLRINELLQQIANGEERDKYRKLMDEGKMTIAELGKVIKDKRDAVVAEVVGETKYDLADEDSAYMSAVEHGDMGTAQRMVDEAAKAAGYDVRGYHGTYNFGKTSFNQYDILFITDDADVASNFSGGQGKRKLSRGEIDAFDSPIEDVVDYVANNSGWRDIRIATTADVDELIKRYSYDKERVKIYSEVRKLVENGEKLFTGMNVTNRKFPPNSQLTDEYWVRERAMETIARKGQSGGVYNLYAKIGNTVIVEGDGDYYANLSVPAELLKYATKPEKNGATTDQITRMAYEAGYDSVTFKNIREGGDYGNAGISTVYAIFNPTENIKSADPVTYDDKGNIIPLSQRFNMESPDIRYDLADDDADKMLNENGEIKDKYFAAAVARAQQGKAPDPEPAEKRAERMIETRKVKFNKLLRQAATIQRKLEKLKKAADKSASASEVKKLQKEYREIMMKLEDLQRELREMGYDLNAESRLIERQQKQIEAQGEVIADLKQQKRELEELEREDRIMRDLAKRESSRIARLYAQQRAEFGNVYNEAEIKRAINDMLERGLISQFFGGQYMPDLSTKQKNGIAEYIAMQLNILGTAEGKQAQNIIHTVANDMIKRMTFTDADTGETLYLDKIVDDDTAKQFTDMIEGDLIGIFQNIGTLNPFSKLQKEFEIVRQKYLDKEKQSKEKQEFGKELPKTYQAALKIKKLAAHGKGTFSEAVQLVADELGKMVDESGHLHFGRIDAAMGEVARFFEGEAMKADSERGQLKDEAKIADDGVVWSVNPALQEQVEKYLRLRKGREGQALTAEELKLVGEVLRGMKTTIERYNKEFINGHWVDVETIASNTAEDLLSFVAKDKEYKTKIGAFLGGKVGKNVDQFYFYYILSPETVIDAIEGYKQGGLLKSLYHSVRVAKQKAEHRAVQMKKPFAEFLDDKENRWEAQKDQGGREGKSYSYRDKLNVRTINVNGTNITLGEAIYLLMLTKREHAWAGLQNEGFITYDENNKQREKVRVDDIPRVRDLIANQLDKTDIKFLEMAEEFFNKTATKVKEDADMEIFGFTNTQAGYYVPIIRDRYSRMGGVTDARQSIGSIITVYNKSFNQNLVENAKALEGKNIMSIINDHANGLADYAELYLPLKAFDRVYNKVVSTSDGNKSIREILNTKVWNGTELYFKDLFSDIQGHGRKQDHVIDKIVGKARSAWVNSVLGANLKVVATQTTSLGAATQVIEPKYIMPAISVIPQFKGDKIAALRERAYKYSDVIEPRSFDMGAIKAQGNVDKINKIGEKSGFLIGVMDEQICLTIFHAAELKVQDTKGYAIGTEDNARLAAKIADEAIYTTQAMTAASERSAMQRSTSEIARLFSMFTSDSVKNLSHLYGNVMKYIAHSQRVKAGDTSYQAALETDKKEIGRSMRTLAITGVMLGLITQAFKYLFAKEEEEPEDKVKDFAIDIASSTLNILPIVSDMVDKFVFNYDMSMNVLDVLNDSIESLAKGFNTVGKSMSGEYVSTGEAAGVAVDVIKSGASMIGFPIAPAERTITGLMRRFVPSAIYGYDAMFSNPSYTADLKDAVENGDEALAEHVLSQLYKNEVNGTYTSAELEEVARLYKAGNTSVIPQKIGAEINGVKLTAAQRKQFTKIYSKASGEVNKLISGSYYSSLNDEQRAKAIKNIYAMFYNRAANEITGKEMTTATAYSYLTSNYAALFASQAYKSGLDEQKDASGNKITVKDQFVDYAANLGLSAEDLLVISYANGVRDKATRAAFLQYLNSLSLTAEIKTQIAERLGFELKDGVIVEKTEQ